MRAISDSLKPPLTLASQVKDLPVQNLDHISRSVNRGPKFVAFSFPAVDPVQLCASASLFRIDFVAEFTFLSDRDRLHDEFHTACFTCAIFSVAVLSEVSPLPVAAGEPMLIEEAHI